MVITDLRMPNTTGMELLREVKSRYPKLPVVLISDIERLLNSLL